MQRLLALLVCASTAAAAHAATVTGKVAFVTRRGQSPVAAETVVTLQPASGKAPHKTPEHLQMLTRAKTLVPHVMVVPTGSTIDFPNDDPISHNLFSVTTGHQFDLGLYRRGAGKSEKFDAPGIVNVYCNIHPNMSAVIHVVDTPWYAMADAAGAFSIADVPPGKYKMTVWNEQGGSADLPVEVVSGKSPDAVTVTLDSRNYRETQHLDKNGKPYVRRDY